MRAAVLASIRGDLGHIIDALSGLSVSLAVSDFIEEFRVEGAEVVVASALL